MPRKSIKISDFRGPALRLEATDVPSTSALLSLNTEYNMGSAGTRAGFGQALDTDLNVAITSLFNWVRNADAAITTGNALAYFTPSDDKAYLIVNLSTGLKYELFTDAAAYAASFASGGSRLYACAFGTDGQGTAQARIVGTDVAAIYIDKAFMGPMTYQPTLSTLGTGNVTAGEHRIGYIVASRTGFIGKISPVSGDTFDVSSVITAPGAQQIRAAFSTTWPTEAATVYPVMTTADNLAQYFMVPGASFGVPGGQAYAFNADLDISDEDLKATGTDVTANLSLLTQDIAGDGPFNPFLIVEYGQRIIYFTSILGISRYYVSDITSGIGINPQAITADQNVRYLPGYRSISSAFVLDNVLYVTGPHWTYADRDNLQRPVEWGSVELVDGQIGAMGPLATTVNSSKGMAWVADSGGLYVFSGGRYSPRPISYMVEPDWRKINLAAGHTVQVKDHKDKQCAYVLVPLATDTVPYPTAPTHIMMFDYSNGVTPEKVKYSLWDLEGYSPSSIEIVQNQTTRRMELWIGPGSAGKLLRQLNWNDDGNPHTDDGEPIDWQYETALLPGAANRSVGMVYRHYDCRIRAAGQGHLDGVTYGIDHNRSVAWKQTELAASPGREYLRSFNILSEGASHLLSTGEAEFDYCVLSAIEHEFADGASFR